MDRYQPKGTGVPKSDRVEVHHESLRLLQRFLERRLRLEHAANIFPLIHIGCYYVTFILLAVPGLVTSVCLQVLLWIGLVLLNFSLSIGIQHMHAHRKLFTSKIANRGVELLLCFPCVTSYPMMKYVHVYVHHKYQDGPGDPTSTRGSARGTRAVLYWLTYSFVAQGVTIKALYSTNAAPIWRDLRIQHTVDNSTVILIGWILVFADPVRTFWLYLLPMSLILLNVGYFAWLTHGTALGKGAMGSLNTVNRWMNLFIHNQGYHYIHHRHPGVHWTRIPDYLHLMKEVDERLIVPYWVTLNSAWRILAPDLFHDGCYGSRWKLRYQAKERLQQCRVPWLYYFSWI